MGERGSKYDQGKKDKVRRVKDICKESKSKEGMQAATHREQPCESGTRRALLENKGATGDECDDGSDGVGERTAYCQGGSTGGTRSLARSTSGSGTSCGGRAGTYGAHGRSGGGGRRWGGCAGSGISYCTSLSDEESVGDTSTLLAVGRRWSWVWSRSSSVSLREGRSTVNALELSNGTVARLETVSVVCGNVECTAHDVILVLTLSCGLSSPTCSETELVPRHEVGPFGDEPWLTAVLWVSCGVENTSDWV